nr:DEAD box protein [Cryptomonas curvata]|mmetsp:Transcript_1519/g.3143  ORF Transcript_1519/g.3143 Transcript_1519/m.3143 type:complete len:398 (+) Transcript_1519:81-1274(+)
MITFRQLGVCEQICRICDSIGFKYATKIQAQTIPYALNNRDILGYAQTGSGKTLAFIIPILQDLLKHKSAFSCLTIVPARELAFQIASQFEILGNVFGIKIALLVGGMENISQISILNRSPHILICTPGRLVDHIGKTKSLSLKNVKNLVFDEADRLFQTDFDKEFLIILSSVPRSKQCFLFSATMTTKVEKLEQISMVNPIKIQVNKKYKIVVTLKQNYIFVPFRFKDCYLAYICNEFTNSSVIIFVDTQSCAEKTALLLKILNFKASCLHGKLDQSKRMEVLYKFKLGQIKILVATDLVSRGIDIPGIDLIVNYDIPLYTKDYIHRVGRTARAGKSGRVINLVTQYDVRSCQKIELLLGKKFDEYHCSAENVLSINKYVSVAKMKINSILQAMKN